MRYEDGSEELYNLVSDPNTRFNMINIEAAQPIVYWLSSFLPRSFSYLYGGEGSDVYQAGGGDVFINEPTSRSSRLDSDELYISAKRQDVSFTQENWGSSTETMKITYPGGSVFVYDQYSAIPRIELLFLEDGFYDFTPAGGGQFFSLP